jgi:hypothetical protein
LSVAAPSAAPNYAGYIFVLDGKRISSPFKPLLAICSDLDETPGTEAYFEIMRFLNTREETSMGQGVGLEVGNTIYFDMALGSLSYWNATEADREKFRALIQSGHIDCLHSFGDLATTRAHAARALEELERHNCRLKVWIDHAQAPSNFGSDIMCGHGDDTGHEVYHSDLTAQYGVEYVWRGRVTSVIGQDRPPSLLGIWNSKHPLASARTIAKEAAKQAFARAGSEKYRLHADNLAVQPVRLRDGRQTQEFLRFNPAWLGVSELDTGWGIEQVLTNRFLDRFVERAGVGILYTHLGKLWPGAVGFDSGTVQAFRRLAAYKEAGKIHVTTTKRVLDICSGKGTPVSLPPLKFPSL